MNSQRSRTWLVGAAVIGAIWIVVFGAVLALRSLEPTADEVQRLVEGRSLDQMTEADRQAFLQDLANGINRLSFEERTALRRSRALEPLVEQMTEAEQRAFLSATLPEGMRQMMQALNAMEPERRQRLVDRAIQDLREADAEELAFELEKEHVQAIVQIGLESYFEEASADTKLQLAPLIEHLQLRLQKLR